MTELTRRGGCSRASATPGRSPRRSRQCVSRGMVTVEMAVSLIAATLVWVVGLSRRRCLPHDGRPGGSSDGSWGYGVGSTGREHSAHRGQDLDHHNWRLGDRDCSG